MQIADSAKRVTSQVGLVSLMNTKLSIAQLLLTQTQ